MNRMTRMLFAAAASVAMTAITFGMFVVMPATLDAGHAAAAVVAGREPICRPQG